MTILNTAVPTIAAALKIKALSMKAVLASYTLSLALFIPISGWMADHFGTRKTFASAIAIFTLGSCLCGICQDVHALVVCRILQGMGGAMMVPVGRLTMVRTFPKSELVNAMSFVAIPALVGPLIGPALGGAIVEYFHWSVIFFLNIPIGCLGYYLVCKYIPDYHSEEQHPPDIAGLLLFGSGISLLSYVLEIFGEHSLSGSQILTLFIVSILLLLLYGIKATRTRFPLLELKLFRYRTFTHAVAGGLLARIGIGGIPFLLPLLYQLGLGLSPLQAGLLMIPQALASISLKPQAAGLLNRFGYKWILVSNTLLVGLLIMSFALINQETPMWMIVLAALCYGFFMSLQFTSMNTLVYADIHEEEASGASSIASTVQQFATSLGVAVASLITACFIPENAHSHLQTMIQGLHHGFLVMGGWTVLTSILFVGLKNNDGSTISMHKEHIAYVSRPPIRLSISRVRSDQ